MFQVILFISAPISVLSIVVNDHPGYLYKYSYNIQDPTTGDSKSLHESKEGDVVTGSYSVLDSDGTQRTVKYTADPKHGFNAVVEKIPTDYHGLLRHGSPESILYRSNIDKRRPEPTYVQDIPYYYSMQYAERPKAFFTPGKVLAPEIFSFGPDKLFLPAMPTLSKSFY